MYQVWYICYWSLVPRDVPLVCSFYTHGRNEPVREWLRALPKDVRLQIGSDILKVQRTWPTSRPLVGSFGTGLYEVITSYDKNEYRVLFCFTTSAMVILHGFQKKTQKTPKWHLSLARSRQKEVGQ